MATRRTAFWVNITMCFSLQDLSFCSDLWIGDRRSVKIGLSFFFRCKCWTLNVSLLYNSSDYLTNTWWSVKTIKTCFFFAIEIQSEDESTRHFSILHLQLFPLYILLLFNVYRYVNNCVQPFASKPIIYSGNESLNVISSDCVLLFTFLFVTRKLYFILSQGTEEVVYLIGTCRSLYALYQNM